MGGEIQETQTQKSTCENEGALRDTMEKRLQEACLNIRSRAWTDHEQVTPAATEIEKFDLILTEPPTFLSAEEMIFFAQYCAQMLMVGKAVFIFTE